MMILPRVSVLNIVNYIYKEFPVIKSEILYHVVGIFEKMTTRVGKWNSALTNTFIVICKIIFFPIIVNLQIITQCGEIVEDLLLRVCFVTVVFCPVLLKVWREHLINWIFTHSGCKNTKNSCFDSANITKKRNQHSLLKKLHNNTKKRCFYHFVQKAQIYRTKVITLNCMVTR